MSALWSTNAGESGILRKNDDKSKIDDLLVFGYACKLFRDDDKAREIDQGKHLIPWMGDNTLKIDRYDGRGALSDLTPYQSSKEGYDAMRWLGLSETERKIEQLCDEERYYALYNNVEEDDLYKEEELKRAQNQGQVQFNYDTSTDKQETEESKIDEMEEELYTPRPELDLPVNMTLPKTVKENARIEKTALFISKEGPQMEILVKTKQANNQQFSFMNQDDPLYRYYRHVLMAIKTGRYKVLTEQEKSDQLEDKKSDDDHYLHPSLARLTEPQDSVSTLTTLPQIFYKPSANCAYSQLVNRIQGNNPNTIPENNSPTVPEVSNGAPGVYNNQQAYIQHYQQYRYYPNFDPNNPYFAQAYAQNPQAYEHYKPQAYEYYEQNAGGNPYAQIVSNVKGKEVPEPPSENGIPVENYPPNTEISKAPIIYSQEPPNQPQLPPTPQIIQNQKPVASTVVPPQETEKPSKKTHNIFSLAAYSGSESESEEENGSEDDNQTQAIVIPPQDTQVIVDKMASYVAKNGIDFENIVKSKGDPRFVFLDPTHVFYPYYKYKLKEFGGGEPTLTSKKEPKETPEKLEEKEKTETEESKNLEDETKVVENVNENKIILKPKEKKIITPVCFSIKKTKDEQPVANNKSALPVEDSTDEDESENNCKEETPSNNSTNSNNSQNQNELKIEDSNIPNQTICDKNNTEDSSTNSNNSDSNNKSASQIIEIEDPIMELIDLTDDLEDRRDAKRAEDRLKDKLALAAREKLAAKNKALQLERKKRAAAFLSQLKPVTTSKAEIEQTKPVVNNPSSPPEEGEINGDTPPIHRLPEDPLKVYHIEPSSSPKSSPEKHSSSPKHKSSHHHSKKKSHKRSRSHSRKRKREKRSHEKKKSKRKKRYRSRSRSRSRSRHHKTTYKSKDSKNNSSSSSDSDDE